MRQIFNSPSVIFVTVNFICFLFYLTPYNIYSLPIPVLAFNTSNNNFLKAGIIDQSIIAPATKTTSDNKSLVFVGDIMLARHVEFLMEKNGSAYPFASSQFLREKPAFVIGNFEATIPPQHTKTPNYTFQFSVNKQFLSELTKVGFTHLSLANNHTLDFGKEGYVNTVETLTKMGIKTFGHSKSLGENTVSYLSASNTKYALIGLNATQLNINTENIKPYLEEVLANSDVQIAYIHWGEEYIHKPSQNQKIVAEFLAKNGIDLVIGHHPHVIQSIEKIGDAVVFYSLGNFIFDQYFNTSVMQGLAIRLSTEGDRLKIILLPYSSEEKKAQPKLLTAENREAILAEIAKNSDKNIAEMIISGEVTTSLSLATSTKIAIMNP